MHMPQTRSADSYLAIEQEISMIQIQSGQIQMFVTSLHDAALSTMILCLI